MKLLTIIALVTLGSSNLLAQDESKGVANLAEFKSNVSKELDERIQILTEAKNCINAASDIEAVRECRKSMRDKLKSDREENKAAREERKAARKAKRADKK